uniref:Serine protease n=1 Tax=Amphiprion percula TaxID=161767 RepID=A0A3P8THN8_AMPPE
MAAPGQVKDEERQEEVEKQHEEEEVEVEEVKKMEEEVEVKEEEEEVENAKEKGKKEEDNIDSKGRHSHQFIEKLANKDEKMLCIFRGPSRFRNTIKKLKEKLTRTEEKKTSGTGSTDNTDESYGWIKRMLSEFDGNSFRKLLELKKENFGKIQLSFSEVHRVKKLLKLGKSVCKVIVSDVCQGTGFVLFDRLILTNAHLFKDCVKEKKLQEDTKVYALFNYDEPEPFTNYDTFAAEKMFIDLDLELDYAILELNPKGQKHNQAAETEEAEVPPGLLSKFGPPPVNGEACLIGHPAGAVKKIDPTCIIPIEKREEAVDKHLHPYKNTLFIVQSIIGMIQKQHIGSIIMGGSKADKVVTYNTFMYHGASGSPVFDVKCRVFGLHTAGYAYGFPKETESVIEFALPLLTIFENFVSKVKKSGNKELLERIQENAIGNSHLEQIIGGLNAEEKMETN